MSEKERERLLIEALEYHSYCPAEVTCTLDAEIQRIKDAA